MVVPRKIRVQEGQQQKVRFFFFNFYFNFNGSRFLLMNDHYWKCFNKSGFFQFTYLFHSTKPNFYITYMNELFSVCVCVCDCFLLTYFYIRYWLPLAQSMQLFAHSLGLASFFTNQKLYSFGFFNWWINKIVFKFKCFYKYFLIRIRRHY